VLLAKASCISCPEALESLHGSRYGDHRNERGGEGTGGLLMNLAGVPALTRRNWHQASSLAIVNDLIRMISRSEI
jgi:hypothetical protein